MDVNQALLVDYSFHFTTSIIIIKSSYLSQLHNNGQYVLGHFPGVNRKTLINYSIHKVSSPN